MKPLAAFWRLPGLGLAVLLAVGWLIYRTGAKSKALGDAEPGPR